MIGNKLIDLLKAGSSPEELKKIDEAVAAKDSETLEQMLEQMLGSMGIPSTFSESFTKQDSEFYAQKPEIVAQGLVGAEIIRITDGTAISRGVIIDVDAWPKPIYERQNEGYSQTPGKIYLYKGGYGKTYFAITAHEPNGTGVVRVIEAMDFKRGEKISTSRLIDHFKLEGMNGRYVNSEDIAVNLREPSSPGHEIMRIDPKPNEKFSVRYKAVKIR